MIQKLKMLVKIADLQMSLWFMRGCNAEPSYRATCEGKRNKWHAVRRRASFLIETLSGNLGKPKYVGVSMPYEEMWLS